MQIEHWRSQTRYPGDQLIYTNLLGPATEGENAQTLMSATSIDTVTHSSATGTSP